MGVGGVGPGFGEGEGSGEKAAPDHPCRGHIFLVSLDPTGVREIQKSSAFLVASPDDLNRQLSTVLVAPTTTGGHAYPVWIPRTLKTTKGQVVLDQLRAVDRQSLVRRLGRIHPRSPA